MLILTARFLFTHRPICDSIKDSIKDRFEKERHYSIYGYVIDRWLNVLPS